MTHSRFYMTLGRRNEFQSPPSQHNGSKTLSEVTFQFMTTPRMSRKTKLLGWKTSREIVGDIKIQLYKEFCPIATLFWVPLIDTSYCLSHVMSRGAASIIRLEPVQSNCQCNQIRGFSLLKVESKDTLLSIEFFYFGRVTTIEIFQKIYL